MTRGGMRENSSGLYRHKKMHRHTCEWCGKKFETMQKVGKFCCKAHKMKAHRVLLAMKNRKRLTDVARKGKHFRPHFLYTKLSSSGSRSPSSSSSS